MSSSRSVKKREIALQKTKLSVYEKTNLVVQCDTDFINLNLLQPATLQPGGGVLPIFG